MSNDDDDDVARDSVEQLLELAERLDAFLEALRAARELSLRRPKPSVGQQVLECSDLRRLIAAYATDVVHGQGWQLVHLVRGVPSLLGRGHNALLDATFAWSPELVLSRTWKSAAGTCCERMHKSSRAM
jgi:hypothetical protein